MSRARRRRGRSPAGLSFRSACGELDAGACGVLSFEPKKKPPEGGGIASAMENRRFTGNGVSRATRISVRVAGSGNYGQQKTRRLFGRRAQTSFVPFLAYQICARLARWKRQKNTRLHLFEIVQMCYARNENMRIARADRSVRFARFSFRSRQTRGKTRTPSTAGFFHARQGRKTHEAKYIRSFKSAPPWRRALRQERFRARGLDRPFAVLSPARFLNPSPRGGSSIQAASCS